MENSDKKFFFRSWTNGKTETSPIIEVDEDDLNFEIERTQSWVNTHVFDDIDSAVQMREELMSNQ